MPVAAVRPGRETGKPLVSMVSAPLAEAPSAPLSIAPKRVFVQTP